MIMFDLDGTLINYECKMSKVMVECLKALKEKGYLLALNSGRPIHLSLKAIDEYLSEDFFDYVFGCNGIEFYDTKQRQYELLNELDPKMIHKIAKYFKLDVLTLGVYEGFDFLINQSYDDPKKDFWFESHFVQTILVDHQKINKAYPKVIGIFNPKDRDKVAMKMQEVKDDEIDFYFSSPMVLEIIPKGASKKDAILKLNEKLNLQKEEILSFGDSMNDVPMLENSIGVAMGDASSEVQKHAKYVTSSVEEEGVLAYLKKEGILDE